MSPHKLFLGGVSPNTTREAIEAHFSKYGQIVDAVVMYKDGKHRGFGFVTFDAAEAMYAALAEEQVIDARVIDVKQAMPQGEAPPPKSIVNGGVPGMGYPGTLGAMQALPDPYAAYAARSTGAASCGGLPRGSSSGPAVDKVFIGGLAQTTTEDQVREYFSRYGTLIDCVVMKDRASQRSRGFGFVQYDNCASVEQVITDYERHQIDGKWVECKKAIPQQHMGGGVPSRSSPAQLAHNSCYGGYAGAYGCGKGAAAWGAGAYAAYGAPAPQYGYAAPAYYDYRAYNPYAAYAAAYQQPTAAAGAHVASPTTKGSYSRSRPY